MNKQIALGIQIIIQNNKKEILLSKRLKKFGFGEWEIPGGHLEFGETFEECITRECAEELGIRVKVCKLVTLAPNMKYGNHYIVFNFLAESFTGEPINKEPEVHSEIGWFSRENLPNNLFIATKQALDGYFSGIVYRHDNS